MGCPKLSVSMVILATVARFTSNASPAPFTCTNLTAWTEDQPPSIGDCANALEVIIRTHVQIFQDERLEFLVPGMENRTTLNTVMTPQRYSYGERTKVTTDSLRYSYRLETCTIVIYMPVQGAGGPLPGSGARSWRSTDIATFRDICISARRIMSKCLLEFTPAKQVGWTITGE